MTTESLAAQRARIYDWPTYVRIAGLIAFASVCWLYTTLFWSDVPYYDEWFNVPNVAAIAEGQFNPLTLLAPAQGHSVFWYRAATWFETVFLGYDPRFCMFLGLCFMTASALLLFRHYAGKGWLGAVLCVASTALIFGLANWENLLATWLVNSAASNFFMLAAILAAHRRPWLAVLFGALCSISFTNGLAVWPCLVGLFWLGDNRKAVAPAIAVGVVLVGRAWVLHGQLGSHPEFVMGVYRFFAVLGLPAALPGADQHLPGQAFSMACGMLFCGAVAVISFITIRRPSYSRWLALSVIAYGLASCALIAWGRSDLDVSQAMSSRYFATAMVAYLGLFLFLAEMPQSLVKTASIWSVSVVFLLISIAAIGSEAHIGPYRKQLVDHWRKALLSYQTAPLSDPLSTPDVLNKYAATLDRLHLGPFRLARAPLPVRIVAFGPTPVAHDQPFNVQPNGGSAIWVRTDKPADPADILVLGGHRLETTVSGNVLTAAVPSSVAAAPGAMPLLVEFDGGAHRAHSPSVAFVVN